MLSPRENLLRVIKYHEEPEYVPTYLNSCFNAGLSGMDLENGPPGGGADGFGVRWFGTASAGGGLISEQGSYVLDDITKWKEVIKFPDVKNYDWEAYSKRAYPPFIDRENVVRGFSVSGPFQRMEVLMGFENCLCDMAEEPEATFDFMSAVADYAIEMCYHAKKHLHLDMFDLADDMATERGLFMSPESYRSLIKPNHKKVYDAVRDMGLIVEQHTCGKAEDLVPDFTDLGIDVWQSVQPVNDIEGILSRYGDRMALVGGFQSNGKPAYTEDPEEIASEVRRCYDTYGKYKGYVFWGFLLNNDPEKVAPRLNALMKEAVSYPLRQREE